MSARCFLGAFTGYLWRVECDEHSHEGQQGYYRPRDFVSEKNARKSLDEHNAQFHAPRPTSEPGVGDPSPAMLGEERGSEPVNASSSSPILVPMDAERIAALREMLDDQMDSSANYAMGGGVVPEKWLRHERVLRAILRDAGADE